MTRARSAFAATLLGATIVGTLVGSSSTLTARGFPPRSRSLGAQALLTADGQASSSAQAAPMKPILAGKKFMSPVKGQADVQYTKPITKPEKDMVVTKVTVKNVSNAPIARLAIDETWYGKDNQSVISSKGFINGLLQPGEIKTIEIRTPHDRKMYSNNWTFSHAYGVVKPHQVKSFEDQNAKEPAAKNASATRKRQ